MTKILTSLRRFFLPSSPWQEFRKGTMIGHTIRTRGRVERKPTYEELKAWYRKRVYRNIAVGSTSVILIGAGMATGNNLSRAAGVVVGMIVVFFMMRTLLHLRKHRDVIKEHRENARR